MTKSFRFRLHQVMMMAWTILISVPYAIPAFAYPGQGILGEIRRVTKDQIQNVKDLIEFGRFERHLVQFTAETKAAFWHDLFGRSWAQTLVIVTTFLALTLCWHGSGRALKGVLKRLFSWKPKIGNHATFIGTQLLFFVLAEAAGWGFELLRTYHMYRWSDTKLGMSQATIPLALVAVGVVLHADVFVTLTKSIRQGQFRYFRKTWELPPEGYGLQAEPQEQEANEPTDQEEPEAIEAGASPAQAAPAAAVATAAVPAPAPAPLVRPQAPPIFTKCRQCGQKVERGFAGCPFCGKGFQDTLKSHVICPNPECGRRTPAQGKGCVFCGTKFVQESDDPEKEPEDLWDDMFKV